MILIEEKKAEKMPGITSLFVSFDYNKDIVNIIKNVKPRFYNKNIKTWEIPTTSIVEILDKLSYIDDIDIIPNKEVDNVENKPISLNIENYKTKPFDYQIEGIKYGLSHNKWLLLDQPGLGKTLQIIYLAQELKTYSNIKHCLIICGINTLKYNWKNEIEKHSDLSCKILGERKRKNGSTYIGSVEDRLNDLKDTINEFFVITNIETLRNSEITKRINSNKDFDMIVVDEIHCCKSVSSQQGKNLLKLKKAKFTIGLTGTLLINSPIDTYVPLHWIGADKSTLTDYKLYYTKTGEFNQIIGFKNIDILKNQLDTVSIRRTKDLLNLPEKTIINEIVDLDQTQETFYNNIKNKIIEEVDLVTINTKNLLSMITRLRQAVSCPSILSTSNIKSNKIDRTIDLIEQILSNNEKVVVFSIFKKTLIDLQERLLKLGYNPLLCTGDIEEQIVYDNIDKFKNDDNKKILLCTTAKMGTGFTLTSANNAIFVDSTWTAAQNLQCEDRIHRIGSSKPVFIYYLWANNTIDLKVKKLVEDKELLSEYVNGDTISTKLYDRLKEIITDLK